MSILPALSGTEEKATAQFLNRLRTDALKKREAFEADWWLNAAFFAGYQYTEWRQGRVAEVARPANATEHTPRIIANKIMHMCMQAHAKAMAHDPRAEVSPTTADAHDRSDARVAQAYLDELMGATKIGWADVRSQGLLWAVIMGTGWHKWFQNEEKGRPDCVALSPFDVVVDPYVQSYAEARYAIHTQFMDVEQVYDKFGVRPRDEGKEQVDSLRSGVLASMGYAPALSGVSVHELWMRPSRRHSDGRYAVWTGNGRVLVAPTAHPYDHKRLPFTILGNVPMPGVPYYHAVTKFLRPAQMALNAAHNQVVASTKAFANPKWWLDSELADSMAAQPTDAPNELLIGDSRGGTVKPEILQGAQLVDNGLIELLRTELEDIAGLHAVSQGDAPGRVDSAKALELLRNEDLTRLAVLNGTLDTAIGDGFGQLLDLARQYASGSSVAVTYTRDGMPEVHQWKAGDSGRHTVRVISAAAVPKTQAAKNEYYLSLWNAGIIKDPRRMCELLELPYAGSGSDTEQDIRWATNENVLIAQGIACTAKAWEDHAAHIREHNAWRKTAEFDAATDAVRSIMEFHVHDHERMEMEEAAKFADEQRQLAEIGAAAAPETAVDPQAIATPPVADGHEEAATE